VKTFLALLATLTLAAGLMGERELGRPTATETKINR